MSNKCIRIAAMVAAVSATGLATAGPGGSCHFHGSKPASDTVIIDCASQRRDSLVADGKLDKAWRSIKIDKAELVDGKKGKEWRVTFRDDTAKDKSKKTLYLFFTAPGNFIAANFTGQ